MPRLSPSGGVEPGGCEKRLHGRTTTETKPHGARRRLEAQLQAQEITRERLLRIAHRATLLSRACTPARGQPRFHSPWEGTRSARLNLADAFSQAMVAVSSTSASSS